MNSSGRARLWIVILLLSAQTMGFFGFPSLVHASNLTFGDPMNLSNDPAVSGFPVIASVGNRVYVAWSNNTGGIQSILFRASINNGTSFGPVIKVTNSPTGDAAYAQIAAVGSYVYIVWQQNVSSTGDDIFFSASTNNGTSFGSPIDVSAGVNGLSDSERPDLAVVSNYVYLVWWATTTHGTFEILTKTSNSNGSNLGTVSSNVVSKTASSTATPQITATGTYVYVTWSDLANTRAQTFFSYSSNNGGIFSTITSLDASPAGQSDLYQAMEVSGSSVYVTWTNDTMFTDNTMFAASSNNGVSFSSAVDLYKAQVTDLSPRVAASSTYAYVVWTNKTGTLFQPGRDILYKASSNNGATFGGIVNLSNTPSKISDSPMIAATGSNVYVTWSEEDSAAKYDVYFISSSNYGSSFGTPLDLSPTSGNTLKPGPVVSAAGSNVYIAWTDDTPVNSNGDILFRGTGSPPTIIDVAITGIYLSKNLTYSGVVNANPIIVNVTASNPGTVTETFIVSAKANSTLVGNNQTITLVPGASRIVTFSWNTASLVCPRLPCRYVITAQASQVPGETPGDPNNNATWGGTFTLRLKGDVDGDCRVDIVDLAAVGSTFGKTIGTPGFNPAADVNNDGIINIVDLVIVASAFGTAC